MNRSTDLKKLSTKTRSKISSSITTMTHSSKENLNDTIPPSDIKIKIENTTEGLSCDCFNLLQNRVLPASNGRENVLTICDYISSSQRLIFQIIIGRTIFCYLVHSRYFLRMLKPSGK